MVSKRMGLNLGGIGRKDLSEERIFKQRSEGWKTDNTWAVEFLWREQHV
jgi:hypothetical protein